MGGFDNSGNAKELQGRPISTTAPTNNQVLEWNGTNWIPANASSGTTTTTQVVSTNHTAVANENTIINGSSGGVTITLPTAPANGTVNYVNNWDPQTNAVAAGGSDAINIYNSVATTKVLSPTYQYAFTYLSGYWYLLNSNVMNGDVLQTNRTTIVERLLDRPLSGTAPTTGQVLEWDGSEWTPTTPSAGSSYTPQYIYQTGNDGAFFLAKIDYTSMQYVARNSDAELGVGAGYMAIDPKGVYGYISCQDEPQLFVQKIDLATFQIVDTLTSYVDNGTNLCVMDPAGEYLYLAESEYLFKIDLTTFTIAQYNDPTGGDGLGGPQALAIDPAGEYLYVATGGGSTGYVYQVKTSDLSAHSNNTDMQYVQSISVSSDSSVIAMVNGTTTLNIYSSSSFGTASSSIDLYSVAEAASNYVLMDPFDSNYVWCNQLGLNLLFHINISAQTGFNPIQNPDNAQWYNAVIDGYGNITSITQNENLFKFAYTDENAYLLPQTQFDYATSTGNIQAFYGFQYFTLH